MKGFVLSADLILLHLDALVCGEYFRFFLFSLACLDEAFAISIGIPPHDKAIFFLHTPSKGVHKHTQYAKRITNACDPFA